MCIMESFCLFWSFVLLSFQRKAMKNIIILVASNCQVRYEAELEAVIQLFGMGTKTLLIFSCCTVAHL